MTWHNLALGRPLTTESTRPSTNLEYCTIWLEMEIQDGGHQTWREVTRQTSYVPQDPDIYGKESTRKNSNWNGEVSQFTGLPEISNRMVLTTDVCLMLCRLRTSDWNNDAGRTLKHNIQLKWLQSVYIAHYWIPPKKKKTGLTRLFRQNKNETKDFTVGKIHATENTAVVKSRN